jgi:hypothetical protein
MIPTARSPVFFPMPGHACSCQQKYIHRPEGCEWAEFTVADVFSHPKCSGFHLADDVTVRHGPLAYYYTRDKGFGRPSAPNGDSVHPACVTSHIQLSRCRALQGIKLLSPVRHQDFIGNKLNESIVDGVQRLRFLAAETRLIFESQRSHA